jgi:hypothetical protein
MPWRVRNPLLVPTTVAPDDANLCREVQGLLAAARRSRQLADALRALLQQRQQLREQLQAVQAAATRRQAAWAVSGEQWPDPMHSCSWAVAAAGCSSVHIRIRCMESLLLLFWSMVAQGCCHA